MDRKTIDNKTIPHLVKESLREFGAQREEPYKWWNWDITCSPKGFFKAHHAQLYV